MVEYLEGILKIANIYFSAIAGCIAISLIRHSKNSKYTKAWYLLIGALILFAVQELLGALRAFNIWSTPYLPHLVPTVILALLIWALVLEMNS